MRLLFVVPGGSQFDPEATLWCGEFLTRFAGRGHDVEVVTTDGAAPASASVGGSASASASGPALALAGGPASAGGVADSVSVGGGPASVGGPFDAVTVHRLAGRRGEDPELHEILGRCIDAGFTPRLDLQEAWMAGLGLVAPELVEWLGERGRDYDAVAFIDGASQAAWSGLAAMASLVPTVLHPLAAADDRFHLGVFDTLLRHPAALGFVDRIEANLVRSRAGSGATGAVVGCGIDVTSLHDASARSGLGADDGFRARVGLGDDPYLLVGAAAAPGQDWVRRCFSAYKRRHPGPLRLVLAGLGPGPDGRANGQMTGEVTAIGSDDRADRVTAMLGAVAFVEPVGVRPLPVSWAEAGALGRPCLVATGARGLLRPRPGALGFGDLVEFEAAVDLLVDGPVAGAALGAEGRQFVELHCRWDDLLARYERLLHVIQSRR